LFISSFCFEAVGIMLVIIAEVFVNIYFFSIDFARASIFYCNTMNSHGAGSHSRLLDLNYPPVEGAGEGASRFNSIPVSHREGSSSMPVQHIQASSSTPPATGEPRIGMRSCPIDVEAIDDDAVIYSSRPLPRVRTCALFWCLSVDMHIILFCFRVSILI
jgi:hypothetical protein